MASTSSPSGDITGPGWWWAILPLDEDRVIDAGWASGSAANSDREIDAAIQKLGAQPQEAA